MCFLFTLHSFITATVLAINKANMFLLEVELTSDTHHALRMTWYGIQLEGAN